METIVGEDEDRDVNEISEETIDEDETEIRDKK